MLQEVVRALGAVPEDPVSWPAVCSVGLGEKPCWLFLHPSTLLTPPTSCRLAENSDGFLPHAVLHLLMSKRMGEREGKGLGELEAQNALGCRADFKGHIGCSAGQRRLSCVEVAPCYKTQTGLGRDKG